MAIFLCLKKNPVRSNLNIKNSASLVGLGFLLIFPKVFCLFAFSFTEYTLGIYSAHFLLQVPQAKQSHTAGAGAGRLLDLWQQRKQQSNPNKTGPERAREQSLVFQMVYQKNYIGQDCVHSVLYAPGKIFHQYFNSPKILSNARSSKLL